MERYLRVNLLGPGPRLMKKRIYRAAVSQRLRNTGIDALRKQNISTPEEMNNDYLALHPRSQLSYLSSALEDTDVRER